MIVRKQPFYGAGGASNLLIMNENENMVDRTATLAPGFLDLTEDRDVQVIDLDGDGALDVVTAATFGDPPRLYINQGCCATACSPGNPCSQGDELPCAAGVNWCGLKDESFRIGPFDGPFGAVPFFCAVATGDIDDDGDEDLYFVDYDNNLEDRLMINDGTGNFTDQTAARMCPETPCFNVSAFGTGGQILDVDDDGCLVIAKSGQVIVSVIYNSKDEFGDCTGQFVSKADLATGDVYMFAMADINRDSSPDVYLVRDSKDGYRIAQGNGAFAGEQIVQNSPKVDDLGGNVRLIDLVGDGTGPLDAVVADVDVEIVVCTGQLALLETVIDAQQIVTISDTLTKRCNGGSNAGLACTSNADCPGGTCTDARPWNTFGTYDTAVFDIDNDQKLDLWTGTCGGNRLFIQGGTDCNTNGVGDGCDISEGTSQDCNGNGVPDSCDIASGTSADCNTNGVPDLCDIVNGSSDDCNADGVPDDDVCQPGVQLIALIARDPTGSNPGSSQVGGTLWRSEKNVASFTFACDITAPGAGDVLIQELLASGAFGSDLSSSFSFAVETPSGDPRVLKIEETSPVLARSTSPGFEEVWYAIRNTGDWSGVGDFEVHYLMMLGDANNDTDTTSSDTQLINAAVPCFAACAPRLDVNGDGFITAFDVGLANSNVTSLSADAPKPIGH